MADAGIAARLLEVRETVQRVHDLFTARRPRELNEDYGVGRLLGHAAVLEQAARTLAVAHAPVQLYDWHRDGDCGHPEPEAYGSGDWHDWDASHPSGEGLGGDDDDRICLDKPMGAPVCRACTELVRSNTGSDTAEVPADECTVTPVLAAHLARTGEER